MSHPAAGRFLSDFRFAIADLILMLLEREAHPAAALGILVQLSARRPASQSIRTSASATTMRILRNEYMTELAIFNTI